MTQHCPDCYEPVSVRKHGKDGRCDWCRANSARVVAYLDSWTTDVTVSDYPTGVAPSRSTPRGPQGRCLAVQTPEISSKGYVP